ncbi:MAG: class IV adenylate cyclase [Bacteroidota bacterium]
MPVNLELKLKVPSHRTFETILEQINAEYKGVLVQKDIYYIVKNGLLKLRVEDGTYCLIKYLRDEKGERWSNYELLFLKGGNPEKYLSDIFATDCVVEKKRKLYLYKNTRIHLDDVKRLGKFLELETIVRKNKKDAQKKFDEIVQLLKLDLTNQIRASYRNLLKKVL